MTHTRRAGARSLGVVLASVVALSLYAPVSSATAKVVRTRVAPAACACTVTLSPVSGIRGSVVSVIQAPRRFPRSEAGMEAPIWSKVVP